jgi:hypothetical protein
MSDDVSDIAAYYNSDPERELWRLERHQLVPQQVKAVG